MKEKLQMNKIKKYDSGITLIALVITIIVLLILAGVTVATLTGDNGILTKAAESKGESIIGEEKEKISLGYLDYQGKKYSNSSASLIVEGASVEPNGNQGWKITFDRTQNKYELSSDGNTIDGPIINNDSSENDSIDDNNWFENMQYGDSINSSEYELLKSVNDFSLTYINLLGGTANAQQFFEEWVNACTQLDLDSVACLSLKNTLNNIQQIIINSNVNSADEFDNLMPPILSVLNGTCQQFGFLWSRNNSTRIWTCNYS